MPTEKVSRIIEFAKGQISEGTDWGISLREALHAGDLPLTLDLLESGLPADMTPEEKLIIDLAAENLMGQPSERRQVKTQPANSNLDKDKVRQAIKEVMTAHLSGK